LTLPCARETKDLWRRYFSPHDLIIGMMEENLSGFLGKYYFLGN
jgi:hypothetical protein